MTRFFLPVSNILKDLNKFKVVRTNFVPRVDVFDEVKEALLTHALGSSAVVLF
jgi:hypothetical protein